MLLISFASSFCPDESWWMHSLLLRLNKLELMQLWKLDACLEILLVEA